MYDSVSLVGDSVSFVWTTCVLDMTAGVLELLCGTRTFLWLPVVRSASTDEIPQLRGTGTWMPSAPVLLISSNAHLFSETGLWQLQEVDRKTVLSSLCRCTTMLDIRSFEREPRNGSRMGRFSLNSI